MNMTSELNPSIASAIREVGALLSFGDSFSIGISEANITDADLESDPTWLFVQCELARKLYKRVRLDTLVEMRKWERDNDPEAHLYRLSGITPEEWIRHMNTVGMNSVNLDDVFNRVYPPEYH